MIGALVFLAGLFAAPALLLLFGHRFRERGARAKHRFWWGVTGYLVGVAVTLGAMLLPPVEWAGGATFRGVVVHGAMLAGLLVGFFVGSLTEPRPPAGGA